MAETVRTLCGIMGPESESNQYLPAATKLGQGNVFTGVCASVRRGGGVCLSACWDTTPPRDQTPQKQTHPPRSRHPPSRTRPPLGPDPPRSRHPLGSRLRHTVNERPVRIYWNAFSFYVYKHDDQKCSVATLDVKGQQVLRRRKIRGIPCMQIVKHANEGWTLGIKLGVDITRSP